MSDIDSELERLNKFYLEIDIDKLRGLSSYHLVESIPKLSKLIKKQREALLCYSELAPVKIMKPNEPYSIDIKMNTSFAKDALDIKWEDL